MRAMPSTRARIAGIAQGFVNRVGKRNGALAGTHAPETLRCIAISKFGQ
jgi:hypothetical protein